MRPLRVAVLCSHRAPGLTHLLEDPKRGIDWDLVCGLTTEGESSMLAPASELDVPCLRHPIRAFYRERHARLSDLGVREEYDEALSAHLSPFRPDLVLLASYLYIVTAPVLERFPLILNIHHSDMTILDGAGRPRYKGLRAVRDALRSGETETRATVHAVTAELDEGPLVLRSWPFPVSRLVKDADLDLFKSETHAHQEWMLRTAWGPLLRRSIALVATGRLRFSEPSARAQGEPKASPGASVGVGPHELMKGTAAFLDGTRGPWDLDNVSGPASLDPLFRRAPVAVAS